MYAAHLWHEHDSAAIHEEKNEEARREDAIGETTEQFNTLAFLPLFEG